MWVYQEDDLAHEMIGREGLLVVMDDSSEFTNEYPLDPLDPKYNVPALICVPSS